MTQDDAEAMKWAHRAADSGHAEAMDFVGFAYLRGAVVKRNPAIAIAYFKEAADESAQAAFDPGQLWLCNNREHRNPPSSPMNRILIPSPLPVFAASQSVAGSH